MDLRLDTLKAASFYLLHNVSTLNQCRNFSCVTVVCKHFAGYQGYPNMSGQLQQILLFTKCHWSGTNSMLTRFRNSDKIKHCSVFREMNPVPLMPCYSPFTL
jgi:hypothetical protein